MWCRIDLWCLSYVAVSYLITVLLSTPVIPIRPCPLFSVTPQFPVLLIQIPPLRLRNPSVKTNVIKQPQRPQSVLRTTLINEWRLVAGMILDSQLNAFIWRNYSVAMARTATRWCLINSQQLLLWVAWWRWCYLCCGTVHHYHLCVS